MTMPGPNEMDNLLSKARQGDRESLGVMLELYRNYLRLLARTQLDLHLQTRANPSDIVQETFLEAYSHFPQFRGHSESELRGWLRPTTIAHSRSVRPATSAPGRTVGSTPGRTSNSSSWVYLPTCFPSLNRDRSTISCGPMFPRIT